MLTAKEFARRAGITYPTIMRWLKAGIVPGAKLMEGTPFGNYWQIPIGSLSKVQKRKPGPKPKAKKGAK